MGADSPACRTGAGRSVATSSARPPLSTADLFRIVVPMDGMDSPITQLVWVTRETITARHVEGLAGLLDEVGALSHAQVRIVVVPHGGRAILPSGSWVDPDGSLSTTTAEFTDHELPPEGILVIAPPI